MSSSRFVRPRIAAHPLAVQVSGISRDICVKFASTAGEWEQAFQLVADNYQARGLECGDADYRFTAYHALPEAVVLVAKEQEQVVATLTLVPDNPLLGLPLESLYRQEIQRLRQQGRRLFEGSCLAVRGLGVRDFLNVFQTLMRVAWQQQLGRGASTNVITVNPRHQLYYSKVLGYSLLGPRRTYDRVQGHPAVAFFVDPPAMKARAPAMFQYMFEQRLPRAALVAPRLPPDLIRHFARHSSQTDPRAVEQILWLTEATRRHKEACGRPEPAV